VYLIPEQSVVPPAYIPYSIGNQFLTMDQLLTNKDKQPIQQPITTSMPTNVHVTTSLPIHIPKGSDH
jgi:hypothetical protein